MASPSKPFPRAAEIISATQPNKPSFPWKFDTPFFTVFKAQGGWVFATITVNKDGTITHIVSKEPDVRAIAQEYFKIAVGKFWAMF